MRFQFRVRTLFIVITVVAVACAWLIPEYRVVQERNAMREWIEKHNGCCLAVPWVLPYLDRGQSETPSFVRRWLGDEMVTLVWIRCSPDDFEDESIRRIQATFQGAAIYIAFSPPAPSIFPSELSRTGVSK